MESGSSHVKTIIKVVLVCIVAIPCIAVTAPYQGESLPVNRSESTPLHQAGKIIGVKPKVSDRGVKVYIVTDGKVPDYDAFPLSGPARLVLDIFHSKAYKNRGKIDLHSHLVKGIRWSNNESDDIRMVFDLVPETGLSYRIIPKEDQLVVYLGEVPDMPPVKSPELSTNTIMPYSSKEQSDKTTMLLPSNHMESIAEIEPGKIILYINSYMDRSMAEEKVHELRKYGYNSFYQEKKISGGTRLRVFVGTFDTKNEARKVGSLLKQNGLISYHMPRIVEQRMKVIPKIVSIEEIGVVETK